MANLPQIVFCTGNQGKLREVNAILDGHVKVVNRDVDLPELQGEPEDIAKAKAKEACRVLGEPVLTEDTSLCFEALEGLPGPYIKWFLKKLKVEGLPNMLAAYEDKSAYAQCIFGFCRPGEEPITFVGRCPGKIIAPAGPRNFGWDPIFCPDEQEGALSFAEMEPAEKNKISHRGRALEKVLEYFCEPSSKKQRTEE